MADTRPVIVGIAPVEGSQPFGPRTRSGAMLIELAGAANYADLRSRFVLWNLLPAPLEEKDANARRRILRLAADEFSLSPKRMYILVGYEVVRAFGRRALPVAGRSTIEPLRWYLAGSGTLCSLLPHPSGRNRWYNDRVNRRAASEFLMAQQGR